jgi:hypothetical protein
MTWRRDLRGGYSREIIDFLLRPEHKSDWLEAIGIDYYKQVRLGLRDLEEHDAGTEAASSD